jgi:adenylate cyclase
MKLWSRAARRGRGLTAALTICGTALLTVLFTQESLFRPEFLSRLELAMLDYRFVLRGPIALDTTDVVVVEISEDSFKSLPDPFPWPRSYYARLLRNLHRAGARVVGLDLILGGTDLYSSANDDSLRRAIRETGIAVLAGKREQDQALVRQSSATENFGNAFYSVDQSLGFVNIRNDADGVYRSYAPMFAVPAPNMEERLLPTFAFAVLNKYYGFPPATTPVPTPRTLLYGGLSIPRADAETFLINFYGPSNTFPRLKFQDIIDDESFTTVEERETREEINTFTDPEFGYLHSGFLKNKIVLVGVTVPEYKDLFPVSMAYGRQKGDNMMYGVEIHANVIQNILRGDFLRRPPLWAEMLAALLLAGLSFVGVALPKGSTSRMYIFVELASLGTAALLLAIVAGFSILLFNKAGVVVNVTGAALAVMGGYVTSTTYHFLVERRERLMIKGMFSTYLNPGLVDELVAHPDRLVLGGRRQELTVLFSDIEGFTGLSQGLPPEQLVGLLNEYLSAMTDVVLENDGTVDKYEGDAVMAFWGAPLPQPDHALRACRAALQMLKRLGELNEKWTAEGRPSLNIRIGVNTGEMVVGNMGSQRKFNYTVIGDSVNVGSRLEGANREYRTHIMVNEKTFRQAEEGVVGRLLDRITVRGRTEIVTVYELLCLTTDPMPEDLVDMLHHYEEGMRHYQNQRWKEAREEFDKALEARPEDHPSKIHHARAAMYEKNPPPEWTGIFRPTLHKQEEGKGGESAG